MGVVTLTDGARRVDIEEVNEARPIYEAPQEALPDIFGNVIVYEGAEHPGEIPLQGRVKSKAEVEALEAFRSERALLTLIERDDTQTTGWKIKTAGAPKAQKVDGDSPDYAVTLTIWRAT